MSDTFRIGVVGLGDWARRAYLPNIELMDDVALAAVSTRSEGNLQAAQALVTAQPRVYRDWGALIADGGLDGLIVATAAPSHREVAEAALRSGLPVLCEKPLAPSTEDCDALAAAVAKGGVLLQVGLEFRHAPVLVATAGRIAEGQIGAPSLVQCEILRDKRDSVTSNPEKWTRLGGVFLEFLCHYLDVMCWLADGEPVAVGGSAGKRLGTEAWDHGAVFVEHDNGATATLAFSLFAPSGGERLRLDVLGDEGSLQVSLKAGEIRHIPAGGEPEDFRVPAPGHPSKPYPGSYEQIRAFVDAVRTGARPAVDAAVWKRVMAVATAAGQAVGGHRRVHLAR